MKKYLSIFVLALLFAPSTFAADFDYGKTSEGLYYHSETRGLVFSRDGSCLMQTNSAQALCSTQWYQNNLKHRPRPDSYYNRIRIMKLMGLK